MLYQSTPYLTKEPPSSIYHWADPPDLAQVSNYTLVGGRYSSLLRVVPLACFSDSYCIFY